MRKLLTLLMTLVLGLTLLACNKEAQSNQEVPYGDLNKTYATLGSTNYTEKQVYDKIRANGYNSFKNEILKNIIPHTEEELSSEDLKEIINMEVYGVKDTKDLDTETKKDKETRFQDKMYQLGITTAEEVKEYYVYRVSQTNFAKTVLKDKDSKYYIGNEYQMENGKEVLVDGKKVKNTNYIDEERKESYYNSNIKDDVNFSSIIIGFRTLADAENAIKAAGGKLTSTGKLDYTKDEAATVKELFVKMFQTINPYKELQFELTNDDVTTLNPQLITIVHDLEKDQYTKYPVQVGDLVYLVYSIEPKQTQTYDEISEEKKQEVLDELIDSLATESFVSTLLNEIFSKLDIKIYDPLFDQLFAKEFKDHKPLAKNEFKGNEDKVAEFKYDGKTYTITVLDFYNKFEAQYGVSSAIEYFVNQQLLSSTYKDKVTKDDEKKFKDSYKANLKSFNNNEVSGFPQAIGEKAFKDLYYGTNNEDEILAYYRARKISDYASKEYPDDIFEILESFGESYVGSKNEDGSVKENRNYFDLSVKHVLLFVDYDMDGTPDNPEAFINKLKDEHKEDFKNAVVELMNMYLKEVHYVVEHDYKDYLDALDWVKEQYTKNGLILSTSTDGTYDKDHCKTWDQTKAKSYNIGIKVEDLGQVNDSNASKYVKAFGVGVKELYNQLLASGAIAPKDGEGTELELKDDYLPAKVEGIEGLIQTSFGYHVLCAYDSEDIVSAKYTKEDDGSDLYDKIKIKWNDEELEINGYSDNVWASANQWKIYFAQMAKDGTVTSLYSKVKTFIGYFYSDFKTRYQDKKFQNILFANRYLGELTFTNKDNNARKDETIEIKVREFDNYEDYSANSGKKFAGWWDKFLEAPKTSK